MDNTAKGVEVVAERRNSKSVYQLNKVTVSQFTLSRNVVSNKQKKTSTQKKKLKKCYFSKINSAGITGHFTNEIAFPELSIKHVTSQSEN